jgi:hypothetical protein
MYKKKKEKVNSQVKSIKTATVKGKTKIASFIENLVGKQTTKERKEKQREKFHDQIYVAMVCSRPIQ